MAEQTLQQQRAMAPDGHRPRFSIPAETAPAAAVMCPTATATVSGLYSWKQPGGLPFGRAELRLDVDGDFPLQVASGQEFAGLAHRVHWIARPLTAEVLPGGVAWSGPISYTNGDTFLFQYTSARIERNGQLMRLTLSGGGPELIRDYKFSSPAFHPVEFEYDAVEGVTPVTSIRTHDHPDRPGSLGDEELSIETVYRRAGFDVRMSGGDSVVPLSLSGANQQWSDAEMHDAMQSFWSRFDNKPQWSLWTLFAAMHEDGESLGGIMFDDIGPNHRQGTALFLKSFIANAPDGDPVPEAWVKRMAFWTAVHEMGHAFNLAHAWQKHLGNAWMPMTSNFEQMTYMNYPFLFPTGSFSEANTIAFFRQFDFRFTDEELLFLRHAPESFVQMGNANWFDNHGFEQAEVSPAPPLRLVVRVNRATPAPGAPPSFEFMEPVVVELKLTNLTSEPMLIPDMLLRTCELLTVVVKRNNEPARTWHPHAHRCWRARSKVLEPGKSEYESLFLSAGEGGWLIAEPGQYTVQVCLRVGGMDVVSEPLTLRVAAPRSFDEQNLAQDFFTDDVGRVLAFDGSRFLGRANDALRAVAAKMQNSRAAVHANVALAMPQARPHKLLEPLPQGTSNGAARQPRCRIRVEVPDEQATRVLTTALGDQPDEARRAAETLGHVDYHYYDEQQCDMLEQHGDRRQAQEARQLQYETLVDRRVLERVIDAVRRKLDGGDDEERRPPRSRSARNR
jgi:hypothetical protein